MSGAGFLIRRPGVMTLIQDSGRLGYHRLGLTTGGPADPLAFDWANRLCGNESGAAALEIAVGGLELDAEVATQVALCGADMPMTINDSPVENWRSHRVHPGDRLALGFARSGVRAYLAVAGGFQLRKTLGSVATVLREGLGGLAGRQLESGDRLPCPEASEEPCLMVPRGYRPVYSGRALLRVVVGYQYEAFSQTARRQLFSAEYRVTAQSDRMGYRLEGPPLKVALPELLSEGICVGAVQVPPDGQPIILLCDRQTIGGYPKLGAVLSVDLGQLVQLPAGGKVTFAPIDVGEARQIRLAATRQFQALQPEVCS